MAVHAVACVLHNHTRVAPMSESQDVLYRIGFVEHPDAQSRLEAFAKGAEAVQSRIGKAVVDAGTAAIEQVNRIEAAMARLDSGSGKSASSPRSDAKPFAATRTPTEAMPGGSIVQAYAKQAEELASIRGNDVASASARIASLKSLSDVEKSIQQTNASTVAESVQRAQAAAAAIREAGKPTPPVTLAVRVTGADSVHASIQSATKDLETLKRVGAINPKIKVGVDDSAVVAASGNLKKFAADATKAYQTATSAAEKANTAEFKAISATSAAAAVASSKRASLSETAGNVSSESYSKESKAATTAFDRIDRGRERVTGAADRAANAIGQLARGAASLGLADQKHADAAAKTLSDVQGTIASIGDGYDALKSAASVVDSVRTSVLTKVAATRADGAAAKIAESSSESLRRALSAESVAAKEASVAHGILNRNRSQSSVARSPRGVSTPTPSHTGRTSTGLGRGAANVAGIVAAGAGASPIAIEGVASLVSALSDTAAASRVQTAALAALRTVTTHVTSLATQLGIPALATQLGTLGSAGAGLVTSFAGVAAAGTAAVAGIAFAGKSAYEFAKEVQTAGFMGGAAVGSWTDKIASSEVSVLSWVGNTTGAFDLIGAAATKEAQDRSVAYAAEASRRIAHLMTIETIELERANSLRSLSENLAGKKFALTQTLANTPQERLGNVGKEISRLEKTLADFDAETSTRTGKLEGREGTLIGQAALAKQQGRPEDAVSAEKQLTELRKSIQSFTTERSKGRESIQGNIESKRYDQIGLVKQVRGEQKDNVLKRAEEANQSLMVGQERVVETRQRLMKATGELPLREGEQPSKPGESRQLGKDYQDAIVQQQERTRKVANDFGLNPEDVQRRTAQAQQQREQAKSAGKELPLDVNIVGQEQIAVKFEVHTDKLVAEIGRHIEAGQKKMYDELRKEVIARADAMESDARAMESSKNVALR